METLHLSEVQLHTVSTFANIYAVVDSTDNLVYADTSQFAAQAKCRDFNNSEKYYHWQPFRVVRLEASLTLALVWKSVLLKFNFN